MTNERSIEILRDLLVTIDNGGVMYFERELKELREAVGVAIKSLQAKYLIDADGNVRPIIPKGKWIATENEEMEIDGYFCSVCDLPMETEEKTDYCPNCGADMREGDVE